MPSELKVFERKEECSPEDEGHIGMVLHQDECRDITQEDIERCLRLATSDGVKAA